MNNSSIPQMIQLFPELLPVERPSITPSITSAPVQTRHHPQDIRLGRPGPAISRPADISAGSSTSATPAPPAPEVSQASPAPAPDSTPRLSPWRQLGCSFPAGTDLANLTAVAGLDWTVAKESLYTATLVPVPKHVAVVRQDTKTVLGVVGRDYGPVQNNALVDTLRDLARHATVTPEAGGALLGGRIVWLLARVAGLGFRIGQDEHEGYLLLTTSHDGQHHLTIGPRTTRLICQNQLSLAVRQIRTAIAAEGEGAGTGYQIRHTRSAGSQLADIQSSLAEAVNTNRRMSDLARYLAGIPSSADLEQQFFKRVFALPDGASESDRAITIRKNREERLQRILASPTSQVQGTAGSAYVLVQAAIEYIDHERPTRVQDGQSAAEARLCSAVFGSGSDLKATAWSTIQDLVR